MNPKSGFLSSEFWFATVLPGVISLLVLTGVIDPGRTSDFEGMLKDIIMGALALITLVTYILKRTELKKASMMLNGENDIIELSTREPEPREEPALG